MVLLDVRTIMVIFAMLAFMFFCLLELAGLHIGNIRGVRQWAVANLCISLGMSLAYFYTVATPGHDWAIAIGATSIAAGVSLQFTGIQAFKEERSNWQVALLFVGVFFCQNIWFSVIHPDIHSRAIANSFLLALIFAACARALLIRIDTPLRTAYWFTGLSFVVLTIVMLIRGIRMWLSPEVSYALYANMPLNSVSFFISCMTQLCVTFGFLLMLNYRLISDLNRIASHDALTGALNRRRLEEEAIRLKTRCIRTGETLAIMVIDIDHFKSINDRFGHSAGDEILRRLTDVAHKSIRPDDYFARYGGDEFCMLLSSTTGSEAWELAERLRQTYSQMTFKIGKESLHVTVSIGVADSASIGLEFSALFAVADQALYQAKQEGRNQVVSYSG